MPGADDFVSGSETGRPEFQTQIRHRGLTVLLDNPKSQFSDTHSGDGRHVWTKCQEEQCRDCGREEMVAHSDSGPH